MLMIVASSICAPEILDIPSYVVYRITLCQYIADPSRDSLCARQ